MNSGITSEFKNAKNLTNFYFFFNSLEKES